MSDLILKAASVSDGGRVIMQTEKRISGRTRYDIVELSDEMNAMADRLGVRLDDSMGLALSLGQSFAAEIRGCRFELSAG